MSAVMLPMSRARALSLWRCRLDSVVSELTEYEVDGEESAKRRSRWTSRIRRTRTGLLPEQSSLNETNNCCSSSTFIFDRADGENMRS